MLRAWSVACSAALFSAAPLIAQRPATADLVWPAPPEAARIRYVGSLSSEADVGRREPFLTRLMRSIVGGSGPRQLRLERPFDVLAEDGQRVYVTNGLRGAVMLFDGSEHRARLIGQDVPGGLAKPMGLGGDGQGNVYVADAGARRVVVFGPDGRYRRAFGGASVLLNPVDVAVDRVTGLAFVVDGFLHQVVIFDSSGALVGRIGKQAGSIGARVARAASDADSTAPAGVPEGHAPGTGEPSDVWENRGGEPGEFRYPVSVALSPGGTVYVSDQMNFRVQAFDRDGRFLTQFGHIGDAPGTFTRPKGISVDGEGHVYVVDAAFNNVQVFDGEGHLLIAFGALGHGDGEHWLPVGMAIDRNDRIYIADRYNNRVQVYQYLPGTPVPMLATPAPAEARSEPR